MLKSSDWVSCALKYSKMFRMIFRGFSVMAKLMCAQGSLVKISDFLVYKYAVSLKFSKNLIYSERVARD